VSYVSPHTHRCQQCVVGNLCVGVRLASWLCLLRYTFMHARTQVLCC
jgi:hypothetical protein